MLGRRINQLSMADMDQWWRRIPPTSRWAQIRAWSQDHWPDDRFAAWYTEGGRPSIPPSFMVTLLFLQLMFGWSDREAVENAQFDDRAKFALGLSRTPEITCDHSTLCKFRAKALDREVGRALLRDTLTEASAAGLLGDAGDIIDSFMVAGAAARQGTLLLIARAIRQVLAEAADAGYEAPTLRRSDYRTSRKPTIVWADADARQALLQDLVADAETLRAWIVTLEAPAESLVQAGQLLATVATQDVVRTDDGSVAIAQQVAPDRILSTVDPDMRHGRKSSSQKFDGYKAHVTVQQPTDDQPRLITGMTVTAGNVPDGDQTVAVLTERCLLTGAVPHQLMGDTAYGGAALRTAVREAMPDVLIEAPVPPTSARQGLFAKTDFVIDLASRTITCPGEHTIGIPRRRASTAVNRPQIVAFPTECCARCPVRSQCVSGSGSRTIRIHPEEALLQAERVRQADPEWQMRYRGRTIVEHVIRGVTRPRDRVSHYWGRKKTEMQLIWQAIGYNIGELARFRSSPGPRST